MAGLEDSNKSTSLDETITVIADGSGSQAQANVVTRVDSSKGLAAQSEIAGNDSLATHRTVNTKVRSDGLTALVTDATVVVESTFGFDQSPDSFFTIVNTGGAGTTWTIYIAGTPNNDPSTPDRDLPAYSKVFTVQAGEVGDEITFRDRIIQELNADTTFRSTVFLKAQRVTDRATIHVYSEVFSVSGEFYERPYSGDFSVTIGGTPGDGVVVVGFDNLISRSKPVTISRDYDSPHRLGLFGITGNVRVEAKELSDIYIQKAMKSGSYDLRVNGSVTPQDFTIPASATTDIFVEHMWFAASANSIKDGQFLGISTILTNGVQVQIKSDNIITTFPVIKSTEDFRDEWSAISGVGHNYNIYIQAGRDSMTAILSFDNPFIMRVAGTFGAGNDDYIRVRIQDNLSASLIRFYFQAKGFEKEP